VKETRVRFASAVIVEMDNIMEDDKDDLELFRDEWRHELNNQRQPGVGQSVENEDEEDDTHVQARALFLKAVEFEENGKHYDAIRFYKRAEKLVPNIEYQTFAYTGKNIKTENAGSNKNNNEERKAKVDKLDTENEADMTNLLLKFSRLGLGCGFLVQPELAQQATHIGNLPTELLNYVLRWVVSSDLDLESLENCSTVSRGFYMAARSEDLWLSVCLKIWGSQARTYKQRNAYSSWREMYLVRPRVTFSGCYASKQSYIREGERGFQDHESHRAWHIVEYFRLIRFFPGGNVAMLMSAEDTDLTAKQLSSWRGCQGLQGVLLGDYKLVDNVVVCLFRRKKETKKFIPLRQRGKKKKEMEPYEVPEQDFHIEFYIKGDSWKSLVWKDYNIVNKYKSGQERVDNLNIKSMNNFPKLTFQPVGSYHFESNSPLQ